MSSSLRLKNKGIHKIGLINNKGDLVGKTLWFFDLKAGSKKLLKFINQHYLTPDNALVGLEATGH